MICFFLGFSRLGLEPRIWPRMLNGATVSKIDRENRMITLIGPEGNSVTAKVDPRVGNMENIKEGDRLHIRYTDAVAISVSEQ